MTMAKTKRAIEEVNALLFDDQKEQNVAAQQKTEPRLLKQRGLSTELEELQPVPYYKRPVVQAAALFAVALPLGWGLISAFSGEDANSQQTSISVAEDNEKQMLKHSLEQEREDHTQAEIQNALRVQKMEVVPARPKPTPQPVRVSQIPSRTITTSPPVRTYTPQATLPVKPVRREPSPVRIQVVKVPTPTPSLKASPPTFEEQEKKWLALSQVGNSGGNIALDQTSDNPSLGTTSTKPKRFDSVISSSSDTRPADYSTPVEQPYSSTNYSTSLQQPYLPANYGSTAQVMVGTEASAEIDRTLSWSANNLASGMQIPIRLVQPLKAIDNSDAIPANSYLIAQVNGDSAGNLQLVATSVLLSVNGKLQPERPLPTVGSLVILSSKAGKPLRAKTNGGSRRGNSFLSTIRNVAGLAPVGGYSNGLYALDSLAQRQAYQYEPISYTLKQGTRCRVYVNKAFVINF